MNQLNKQGFEAKILELPDTADYCIIGDPHSCLDELKQLILDDKGWTIENDIMYNYNRYTHRQRFHFKFILVGDYLDKGPQLSEIIRFLYKNKEHFVFVKGNHENFVNTYLNGKRGSYESNKDLIEGYFNSIYVLEKVPELKEMFFKLFENSYDFVFTSKFIVTHSPCKPEYLGKTDKKSISEQRNFVYPKRRQFVSDEEHFAAKCEAFDFLNTEHNFNGYHIFGHVVTKNVFVDKKRIGIDTGCADGGKLSCVMFLQDKEDYIISSYPSFKSKFENLNAVLNEERIQTVE